MPNKITSLRNKLQGKSEFFVERTAHGLCSLLLVSAVLSVPGLLPGSAEALRLLGSRRRGPPAGRWAVLSSHPFFPGRSGMRSGGRPLRDRRHCDVCSPDWQCRRPNSPCRGSWDSSCLLASALLEANRVRKACLCFG